MRDVGRRLRRLGDLPRDHPAKMFAVTAAVCLVCSLVVSTTAVLLGPRQAANRERERGRRVLAILEGIPGMPALLGGIDLANLEARVVDLERGRYAADVDPATYDQAGAAADPARSIALPPERDLAGLGRRARWATVYLVRQAGRPALVILPVHGAGFQSMLRGFVALDGTTDVVRALAFYEQGETPGLGAQIESPEWLAKWPGVRVRDDAGRLRVQVARGTATSVYEVDGISGATWTGAGVTNLLRFWLGPDGFGPFLGWLAAGERDR